LPKKCRHPLLLQDQVVLVVLMDRTVRQAGEVDDLTDHRATAIDRVAPDGQNKRSPVKQRQAIQQQ
jgi:hypothetical protein